MNRLKSHGSRNGGHSVSGHCQFGPLRYCFMVHEQCSEIMAGKIHEATARSKYAYRTTSRVPNNEGIPANSE